MERRYYFGLSPEGFHPLCYGEWGKQNEGSGVLCVHGLTRNKSDFSYLAESLKQDFHVTALDVVGRGESAYFQNPQYYSYQQYLSDIYTLVARLRWENIYWIGSSMGGLLGMIMASLPNSPVKALILNDIGPFIPKETAEKIRQYAGTKVNFSTLEEGKEFLKQRYGGFGIEHPEHWEHFFHHSLVKDQDGSYTLAYDPQVSNVIADQATSIPSLQDAAGNFLFWHYWHHVKCPVLLIRGESSDVLPYSVIEKMQSMGPKFELVEIKNAGHAPALMEKEHIDIIHRWLLKSIS